MRGVVLALVGASSLALLACAPGASTRPLRRNTTAVGTAAASATGAIDGRTRQTEAPVAATTLAPPPAAAPATQDYRATFKSPAAGQRFVGTAKCLSCHDEDAPDWKDSRHASTLRPASMDDEDRLANLVPCSDMGVQKVLGGVHQLRFLVEEPGTDWGKGRLLLLPCAWNAATKSLEMRHAEDWRTLPFETSCAHCHVTDQAKDWSYHEASIGCEACHAAGSAHAEDPTAQNTWSFKGRTAAEEVTVCASCHLQGGKSKRTGRNFPDGYVPGGSLFDDFEFDWASLDNAPVEEAIDMHQKKLIRDIVVNGEQGLRCTSCHEMHGMKHEKHEKLPRQAFCDTCHEPGSNKLKEYRQSCPVCEF